MWMMAFLLLPLVGVAYAAWHLWTLLPLAAWAKALLIACGVVSILVMFVGFAGALDRLPMWAATCCYNIGTSSIFVLLFMVMLFLLLDLGRLCRVVPRDWLHQNGVASLVVAGTLLAVFTYGFFHYKHKVRVELSLKSEKPLARPLCVVMLSDMHLGYHNQNAELQRWVNLINAENPDLILIAGDIIDMSMRPLLEQNMAATLATLKAPVYACLGNHEYYSGDARAQQFFRDAHVTLLRDSCAVAGDLCIIGRDDRTNLQRKSVAELVRTADASKYTILLDHQPYHLERTEQAGIDFQLSGHTHRGQVWPVSWITDALYECSWGSHQRGRTRYYVSSGLGIWGGRYRIGTQSEYVVATIE